MKVYSPETVMEITGELRVAYPIFISPEMMEEIMSASLEVEDKLLKAIRKQRKEIRGQISPRNYNQVPEVNYRWIERKIS